MKPQTALVLLQGSRGVGGSPEQMSDVHVSAYEKHLRCQRRFVSDGFKMLKALGIADSEMQELAEKIFSSTTLVELTTAGGGR